MVTASLPVTRTDSRSPFLLALLTESIVYSLCFLRGNVGPQTMQKFLPRYTGFLSVESSG